MHALHERAALRAAHFTSPIPTLGAEEELQVVDSSGNLVSHDVELGQQMIPDRNGTSSAEFHRCALEIQTPVGRSPNEVVDSIASMRAVAAARARAQGQRVLSAGLHPSARWAEQPLNDNPATHPHYAKVLSDFRDAARGAMAFGLHVHIGITRSSLRIEVMNRLRDVLPMILAISANAPFYEGRDTGLQSWRHSLLGRMPRMGLPEVWATEDAYWSHVNRLRGIGLIGMNAGLWEDLRLHHIYGTLEVRIMDSVFSLDRLWLIVALLQAEATTIEAELLANRAGLPTPRMLLEENKWAARRYGMKASFIDWNSDRRVEFREAFQMWLSRLAPAARHLGFALRLELAARTALHEGTLADKQRQWFSQAGSMAELVDQLVAETTRPLSKMLVDPEV